MNERTAGFTNLPAVYASPRNFSVLKIIHGPDGPVVFSIAWAEEWALRRLGALAGPTRPRLPTARVVRRAKNQLSQPTPGSSPKVIHTIADSLRSSPSPSPPLKLAAGRSDITTRKGHAGGRVGRRRPGSFNATMVTHASPTLDWSTSYQAGSSR